MNELGKHIVLIGPHQLQNELMCCKIFCQTGTRCSALSSVQQIAEQPPSHPQIRQLILLDFQVAEIMGLKKAIWALTENLAPGFLLALFNMKPDGELVQQAIGLGVMGFFYPHDTVQSLTKGIDCLFDGDMWVPRKQMVDFLLHHHPAESDARAPDGHPLTHREEEVLALVVLGLTNDNIARRLCVSHHTIRTHIYNIFKKIHVSNRLEATIWAADHLPSYH